MTPTPSELSRDAAGSRTGELLAVGFDTGAGRAVHVDDHDLDHWRERGHGGTRTLVCHLCLLGFEARAGSRIPLVVRGRIGGTRRPHFAHPPGRAPRGGHHPETLWHLTSKTAIARWAAAQGDVASVRLEEWTPDRLRRADVAAHLADGSRIVLEAQARLLTDASWTARHRDYRSQGIRDVWFFKPGGANARVVLAHGQPLWQFDPFTQTVDGFLGRGHPTTGRWWEHEDQGPYALHHPPCPLDELVRFRVPLAELRLSASGIALPDEAVRAVEDGRVHLAHLAGRIRRTASEHAERTAAARTRAGGLRGNARVPYADRRARPPVAAPRRVPRVSDPAPAAPLPARGAPPATVPWTPSWRASDATSHAERATCAPEVTDNQHG